MLFSMCDVDSILIHMCVPFFTSINFAVMSVIGPCLDNTMKAFCYQVATVLHVENHYAVCVK